jgi:carotenoid 1,2-hydratase
MPTLPLYTPNDVPDAFHRVTAPGGYEWWHFDGESTSGEVRFVAVLSDGFVFHPDYLRRYVSYRRRPTRRPPPVPAEYRCAHFAIYERERLAAQFTTHYPPEQFTASALQPSVTIAANEFVRHSDGALSLRLRAVPSKSTWHGPRHDPAHCLSAQLTFRPLLPHPPHEITLLSNGVSPAEHRWVIADPLCEVSGTILLTGGEAAGARAAREIDFRGRGYHDHGYGTAPMSQGLRRWMRGRVLAEGRSLALHVAEPHDAAAATEIRLIEADAAGVRELTVETPGPVWSRTAALLRYPVELRIRTFGREELRLFDPSVLDAGPLYTRLLYSAVVGAQVRRAFCEVAYPQRLRWPVLGRLMLRFIQQVDGEAGHAAGHA